MENTKLPTTFKTQWAMIPDSAYLENERGPCSRSNIGLTGQAPPKISDEKDLGSHGR